MVGSGSREGWRSRKQGEGAVDEKFEGRNAVQLIVKGIGTRYAPLVA